MDSLIAFTYGLWDLFGVCVEVFEHFGGRLVTDMKPNRISLHSMWDGYQLTISRKGVLTEECFEPFVGVSHLVFLFAGWMPGLYLMTGGIVINDA